MTNACVIICCWKVRVHAFLTSSTYNFPHVHQTLKTSCKLRFPRNLMSFTAQACFKGRLINLHCWEQSTVGQKWSEKHQLYFLSHQKKSAVTDHPDMCGFLYWETVYLGRFLPHHIECHLDIREQLMSHTLTAYYFSPVTNETTVTSSLIGFCGGVKSGNQSLTRAPEARGKVTHISFFLL